MFSFSIRAQAVLAAAFFCAAGPVAAQQKRPAAPAKATVPASKNTNAQQALLAHEAEVTALLGKLTLEEKIKMVHANSAFAAGGIPRLGIPEVMTSDGPHGVRPEQGRN
jgi:beta-glucosidase